MIQDAEEITPDRKRQARHRQRQQRQHSVESQQEDIKLHQHWTTQGIRQGETHGCRGSADTGNASRTQGSIQRSLAPKHPARTAEDHITKWYARERHAPNANKGTKQSLMEFP
eukprot:TRINITY_DN4285_c0_g1_i1.p2 TRINITY_DN4285_c0_g1~~TRINITY_DN4285_c0_g1_i1.p2  ORF type:complete len:113 (+),score=11.89 TRINITY_DN4285_c0_g1_i1:162-500(+)